MCLSPVFFLFSYLSFANALCQYHFKHGYLNHILWKALAHFAFTSTLHRSSKLWMLSFITSMIYCRFSVMYSIFLYPMTSLLQYSFKNGGSYRFVCLCAHICVYTHTLLLGVRAPPVSCPLTGAILPVFTHLPPPPLPTVPWTVPCNPEAQCLTATLTTHWTATCCVQSPPPPPLLLYAPPSPPCSNPKATPPTPALLQTTSPPCSTRLRQTLLFFSELSTVELSLSLYG